jgi:phosphopantothenoylcysteine decarboxylase/phosphopantothenate--cysteine ligase
MSNSERRRRIVLGVSGSIAAYKSAELVRLLIAAGFDVRCVMTSSAQQFITPLTLQTLSGNPVITQFWNEQELGIGHIELADWADLILIAPATADILMKLAQGAADTPLLAIALATKAPIMAAPAMNVHMYEHPATVENLRVLKARGVMQIHPEHGALACGWIGSGRLADLHEIVHYVHRALREQDFSGQRIVITTGATREAIDPVRFISNRSSGKMGMALAFEAFYRGADVTLIHGTIQPEISRVFKSIPVVSARDMEEALLPFLAPEKADIVIMAAAVADYRPETLATKKIKRQGTAPQIPLIENRDILAELSRHRGSKESPLLIGFAVETGEDVEIVEEVRRKLVTKQVDMMVGNRASEALEQDTNRAWIVSRNGSHEEIATMTKDRVAHRILNAVRKL